MEIEMQATELRPYNQEVRLGKEKLNQHFRNIYYTFLLLLFFLDRGYF